MIKHSTVFQPRIIRIVEIIFLSLFIISLFIPYAYGVKPKVFFWDIWSSDGGIWTEFFIVGLPLILSFFLFILKFGKFKFGKLTISLIQWSALIIYAFIMVLFLIEVGKGIINYGFFADGVFIIIYIFPLVLSLFLIVLTMLKSKDNYLKIENYILSIITIPVVYFFFLFILDFGFGFEFGGYLLNICFAVLYVIAVLKVFLLKKNEKNPSA